MDPIVARKTWRTVEPLHGIIYFAPEAAERYTKLGLETGPMGYFASRAAAMGPVGADVVIATFFNFYPPLVRGAIPRAWGLASPSDILAARLDAADAVLRRTLGEGVASPEMAEAAHLARRAALAATEHPEGRPLFAAHAALPWPDEPHLVLWHGQTLLREFRGDGHVAALTADGETALDALGMHAASGDVPAAALQSTRAWPAVEWDAAVDRLRSTGVIEPDEPLRLTESGRARRQAVEDQTDAAAVVAYEPLGDDGCTRLRELARPFSQAITTGGGLGGVR